MEAKIAFKQRHDIANDKLKLIAIPQIDKHSLKKATEAVADKLGISPQTVVNYTYGRGKDGFLTEAITKEFKSLKL